MTVKPIPEGYHSITPYLMVQEAGKAIDFYKQAFGAVELYRMDGPEGKISHAELTIGDSRVMLADEVPEFKSPQTLGGAGVNLLLYVEDADKVFGKALAAGAKEQRPLKDQFYGDRSGTLIDPFGHIWTIATHKEDVPPEEMEKRIQQSMKQ